MSEAVRRRFWTDAEVEILADGFGVRLDERPLRLPGGGAVRIRSRDLADAVALEWRLAGGAKGGIFGAGDLVLTALAGTLQQHVEPDPAGAAMRLAFYVDGELLCYRAAYPRELAELQQAEWGPWLDWIAERIGMSMVVGEGVMPLRQPGPVRQALHGQLAGLSGAALAGLGVVVPASGSLVLGLALACGRIDAEELFRLGRLDEDFQARHWGQDTEMRTQAVRLRAEIALAARFMTLAGAALTDGTPAGG